LVKKLFLAFCFLLFSILCNAQSNDVSFSVGGLFSPDSNLPNPACTAVVGQNCSGALTIQTKVAYEGVFAHRLLNLHLASLHLELPILGSPNRDVHGVFNGSYSSVFVTPGLRLRFSLPGFSPFFSAGGGLAHFSTSSSLGSGNTTGAFQVGGGVDVSTPIPLIGLRAEVREFYTGQPNFSTTQQNLFVGGGIVLKF
jgi:hypothetical protein